MQNYQELNLDGLVGPTHNYAGLSPGNLASEGHRGQASSPRQAALQGLDKMWKLHNLGVPQAVFPPHRVPRLDQLRALGFSGDTGQLLAQAYRQAPNLLAACFSASSMWAANSATVTCSADSRDGRVHVTPANLISNLHRCFEAEDGGRILKRLFPDPELFVHHPPLPACSGFGDEGAANHTRLCTAHSQPGITLLTYGQGYSGPKPARYPARHTQATAEAIRRSHKLNSHNCLLIQQLPSAIDQGVFHNDVIAVGHRNLLLLHEEAWLDQEAHLEQLQRLWGRHEPPLSVLQVSSQQLSVADAVSSYLFNSQIITRQDGSLLLIAPQESQAQTAARETIESLIAADNPLAAVEYADLRQSMSNGGGPACLRLRVPLSSRELEAMHPGVRLDAELYAHLKGWVERHYRDQLFPSDLRDPALVDECFSALEALEDILDLPGLYAEL